jgi:hypothetical protein
MAAAEGHVGGLGEGRADAVVEAPGGLRSRASPVSTCSDQPNVGRQLLTQPGRVPSDQGKRGRCLTMAQDPDDRLLGDLWDVGFGLRSRGCWVVNGRCDGHRSATLAMACLSRPVNQDARLRRLPGAG